MADNEVSGAGFLLSSSLGPGPSSSSSSSGVPVAVAVGVAVAVAVAVADSLAGSGSVAEFDFVAAKRAACARVYFQTPELDAIRVGSRRPPRSCQSARELVT